MKKNINIFAYSLYFQFNAWSVLYSHATELIFCMFVSAFQATNKIELDPDAFEKLKVVRGDFMKALEDIKPVCGTKTHQLSVFGHFSILKNIILFLMCIKI